MACVTRMLAGAIAACVSAAVAIEPGDLVFVRTASGGTELDDAILATGRATLQWMRARGIAVDPRNETADHVAIAVAGQDGDVVAFAEALPPRVVLTPAAAFFARYTDDAKLYTAQVPPAFREHAAAAARIAAAQQGKPYSDDFSPPPNQFYCSSLITWAYAQTCNNRSRWPVVHLDSPHCLLVAPALITTN